MKNNMEKNNGKMNNNNKRLWQVLTIVLTAITIPLLVLTYNGMTKQADATATDLAEHKKSQVANDLLTATTLTSIDARLSNIEKALKIK
jgi:DMSO/TMAO reductase YedYZ heme-binding membrane subunit